MKHLIALMCVTATSAFADGSVIENVTARNDGNTWRFDVTLSHPDTGWDHYVDGWRVVDMDGKELGMRVLYHPHVDEQPFTRSLSGVVVPEDARQVRVQSRCIVDGWSDDYYTVNLK